MAARRRCHHAEAPRPTWIVTIKAAPPAPARKLGPPAHSPGLLSPSVWQNAQKGGADGGAPASPRIGCMGQVKGVRRRCSSARRAAARGTGSGFCSRSLAGLLSGLFGRRRRAYSQVRDVATDSSSSSEGSSRGARAACPFDRPLPVPVVRRPTMEENAPSLWERRRGCGKALEGLQLT